MKRMILTILSMLATALALSAERAHAQQPSTAQVLFTEQVHPFLRKNCAVCHDENAGYPAGPRHSHSDPTLAFQTFRKFIDVQNVEKSRLLEYAATLHFCNEYETHCDIGEKLVSDLRQIVLGYMDILKGRLSSASASMAYESEGRKIPENPTNEFTLNFKIPKKYDRTGGKIIAEFSKIGRDTFRLKELRISTGERIMSIEGLYFFVDGKKLSDNTGFETLKRAIFNPFGKVFKRLEETIAPYHPLIQLAGRELKIGFRSIQFVDQFPERICRDDADWKSFSEASHATLIHAVTTNQMDFDVINAMSEKERCYWLESRVDLRSFRRSTILTQINGLEKNTTIPNRIRELIDAYNQKQNGQ